MRTAYRVLSLLATARAASRGPGPLARNLTRRYAHKSLARAMRRAGL